MYLCIYVLVHESYICPTEATECEIRNPPCPLLPMALGHPPHPDDSRGKLSSALRVGRWEARLGRIKVESSLFLFSAARSITRCAEYEVESIAWRPGCARAATLMGQLMGCQGMRERPLPPDVVG
jgi:hypothetical protein